jgi:hypothetical protein
MNLLSNVKITKVHAYAGAGTATIVSAEVDMSGFDGVVFLASVGTAAAGNYMTVQQYPATGGSGSADLLGTKVGVSKTDMVIDIYKPQERFLTASVVLGTSSTVEAMWAIQYQGRLGSQLAANITTAQAAEIHASPDEGTA